MDDRPKVAELKDASIFVNSLESVPEALEFWTPVLAKQPLGGCHSAPQSPPFINVPVIFGQQKHVSSPAFCS